MVRFTKTAHPLKVHGAMQRRLVFNVLSHVPLLSTDGFSDLIFNRSLAALPVAALETKEFE